MPLNLLVGPANAGKVQRLLEQFAAALDRHPLLVVPNAGDIAHLQRDLLDRTKVLFAGRVGTFDDLFRELDGATGARSVLGDLAVLSMRWSRGSPSSSRRLSSRERFPERSARSTRSTSISSHGWAWLIASANAG